MSVQIKEINFGIAFQTYDSLKNPLILINKNLKNFDYKLYLEVLKHEREHVYKGGFVDFLTEFKDLFNWDKQRRLFRFCIKYPRSFFYLSPVLYFDGMLKINLYMVLIWILLSAIIFGGLV